jgi:hypothetical protein
MGEIGISPTAGAPYRAGESKLLSKDAANADALVARSAMHFGGMSSPSYLVRQRSGRIVARKWRSADHEGLRRRFMCEAVGESTSQSDP